MAISLDKYRGMFSFFLGAVETIRTSDFLLRSEILYPLSYNRIGSILTRLTKNYIQHQQTYQQQNRSKHQAKF